MASETGNEYKTEAEFQSIWVAFSYNKETVIARRIIQNLEKYKNMFAVILV